MTVTFQLPPALEARIEAIIHRTGRNRDAVIEDILTQGIEDVEDYHRGAEVLERIRNGDEELLSASDMRRELGLDD
ncbi:RHH-type transcriptional regulator, rel operon repressor / antitoxin RelB [Devosia enhydra]|uniref:RHH-type transcriptional regulator, rel operon repressor / antitoxin RelB n=1 Tax=Devosia enhydra TaxID=665118 RepID=A0A1K2HZB5_9HYPH|nr:hypothetical protein [Devosia enhydra]SFZ85173.1 RHH-type transcriptional regulator, rel operon repressor / antitoxin RelB [Devosia enhydra]